MKTSEALEAIDLTSRVFRPLLLMAMAAVACGRANEPLAPENAVVAQSENGGLRKTDAAGVRATNAQLTFLNGDDGQPVSGATVTIAGRPFTTDASGQVAAPEPLLPDASIEVAGSGFLKRETLARTDLRFPLWPDRSGVPAGFTQEIVFDPSFAEDNKLTRPTGPIFIQFSAEVDDQAKGVMADAAATLTAANGQIAFSVGSGAAVIQVKIDPGHAFFAQSPGSAAVAAVPHLHNVIGASNGQIIFKSADFSHVKALAIHELGHHFGLGHPTSMGAVMNPAVDANRSDYTDAEKVVMRMMVQRRPGNAFPDNDRAVASAARGGGVRLYVCGVQ